MTSKKFDWDKHIIRTSLKYDDHNPVQRKLMEDYLVRQKIKIPDFSDYRGSLGVIENIINFKIKRVYFLHSLKKNIRRGSHAHKKNIQFFICLSGKAEIIFKKKKYLLSKPNYGILVKPSDWHEIVPKIDSTIILVLASHTYNKKDYIYEK